MSISAIAHSPPPQAAPASKVAKDQDGDEATETSAKRGQEAGATSASLPADPNKGRNLNVLA